jgi:PAS domain S-box-containing protein
LMENVKDYAIFMLDTSGRIVSWNTGAEHILGYRERGIFTSRCRGRRPRGDSTYVRQQPVRRH